MQAHVVFHAHLPHNHPHKTTHFLPAEGTAKPLRRACPPRNRKHLFAVFGALFKTRLSGRLCLRGAPSSSIHSSGCRFKLQAVQSFVPTCAYAYCIRKAITSGSLNSILDYCSKLLGNGGSGGGARGVRACRGGAEGAADDTASLLLASAARRK